MKEFYERTNILESRDTYLNVYYDTTCEYLQEIQSKTLIENLKFASKTSYYANTPNNDNILSFRTLTKEDLLNVNEFKHHDYDKLVKYKFLTSGTTTGKSSEQPWDEWSYIKNFCESSAMALSHLDLVEDGRLVIIAAHPEAALGLSYKWACETLGISYVFETSMFMDDQLYQETHKTIETKGVSTIVGAPQIISRFISQLNKKKKSPKNLNVKLIISGIGNFLTKRHVEQFINEFAPELIIEQAGKNEICHAVGGIRYNKENPNSICPEGHVHYFPWSTYAITVKKEDFENGNLVPMNNREKGVLLMSRLSPKKHGCVSYINEAGDYGETIGISEDDNPCNCGTRLPSFKYSGRIHQAVTTSFGLTIFPEEIMIAVNETSQDLGIDHKLSTLIKCKMIYTTSEENVDHEGFFFILGLPSTLLKDKNIIDSFTNKFLNNMQYFNKYILKSYDKRKQNIKVCYIHEEALPHLGRDKPKYKLSEHIIVKSQQDPLLEVRKLLKTELATNIVHIGTYDA